uniref:5-hydroxytryptamine receptor-like n=1 Tax=Phallusia mammillata TaxID=59560 RepID=A0A6F9DF38_9ASCI|nr:5-hydroxytryptamine receptor-like [Phallusia mammillata]
MSNISMDGLECTNTSGPYCGIYDAGRIVDAIFLVILTVVGTVGNFLVIFSIICARRVNKNGNVFIINLALADLIVTGFFTPTVVANVIRTTNALSDTACDVAGYLVTVSCVCSASNLMSIAFNRYWAVVRQPTYNKVFTKRRIYLLAILNWVWANLLIMPTLLGWTHLEYGTGMMLCSYDNVSAPGYNAFVLILAIAFPITAIVFFYWRLFSAVKKRGKVVKKMSSHTNSGLRNMEQRQLKKQLNLAKTLSIAVIAYVVSWTPYGILIILPQDLVPPLAKRIASRLILTNSVVNFIIYGVMNPTYRKGYKRLLSFMFCCKTGKGKWKSEMDSSTTGQPSTVRSRFKSRFMKSGESPGKSPSSVSRKGNFRSGTPSGSNDTLNAI